MDAWNQEQEINLYRFNEMPQVEVSLLENRGRQLSSISILDFTPHDFSTR